jgi:hypothetical protein
MRRYTVDTPESLFEALRSSHSGIRRVVTSPFGPNVPGVGIVHLELADDRWLAIAAGREGLESRFEVFPITVALADRPVSSDLEASLDMSAPVSFSVLETEDWLDPSVKCNGALGSDPIAQCQGYPGTAPPTASASCRYAGGVRFCSADGARLMVATLAFPYSLYCSAIPQGANLDESLYGHRDEA